MKRWLYMLVLLLLVIVPVTGQKTESWRYNCRQECARKNNLCLQESQGDGPKKEACEKAYRSCIYYCAHPTRKG